MVPFVEMGTWNVTWPVLDGSDRPRSNTTVPLLLFVIEAPDATEPKNAGVPRVSPRAAVGKVTFADPSEAVLEVFETTNFTAPYDVFVHSVCAVVDPATGADGLLTAPDGNRKV